MNDRDFCIEFVKRIPRPARTKTHLEMIKIVENNDPQVPGGMFHDHAIDELFRSSPVAGFVYRYIRDNQGQFIKRKYINEEGHIGELEVYDNGCVVRLMKLGVWDGTVGEIRQPKVALPPDTLYDRYEGRLKDCIHWLTEKGFK